MINLCHNCAMTDGPNKHAVSRRDFLKIGALSLGSLAFNPNRLQVPNAVDTRDIVGEKVVLGNLNVTPIITEHNRQAWVENGEQILEALRGFPTVIPEYFPPDYELHLTDDPLVVSGIDRFSKYKELNFAIFSS